MIGRYPRYHELWERFRGAGDSAERADKYFQPQDFTDLQVLSQIAWFDEFFLEDPDVAALIKKGHGFSLEDQRFGDRPPARFAGRGAARPCRGGAAGTNRNLDFAFLSPHSAAGVRHQRGCGLDARAAACRRTVFAIPKTRVSSCCAGSTCTRKSSAFVRSECGLRRAACQRRCLPSRRAWV